MQELTMDEIDAVGGGLPMLVVAVVVVGLLVVSTSVW